MNRTLMPFAAALILTGTACNGEQGGQTAAANQGGSSTEAPVAPPADGDWGKVITKTAEGGYRIGNPNADVKLVEFASMTCPHCAQFSETGVEPLVNQYVKDGRVSFELRNFVRDPLDITMALIARCGDTERFFPLTDAMFSNQADFFEQVQSATPERQQELMQLPPSQQFAGYAEIAGIQQFAAQRGVPSAQQQQCLSNQAEIERLVQMTSDASTQNNVQGTPSFLINGELVTDASTWETLEPKIKSALGS